jgi:hypothetical protein
VAAKIINADQKAQHLKKPGLQAQLAQLEEQLVQYKKVDQEFKARIATEKADLEKSFAEKLEREKAEAVNEIKEKAEAEAKKTLRDSLLVVSQFLRLAAARRAEEADQSVDENGALEGVLLAVYTGDENAVATMLKLVEGSDEKTTNTFGETLKTTCKCYEQTFRWPFGEHALTFALDADVKAASQAFKLATYGTESLETDAETVTADPASDPTLVNASLTEIQAGDDNAWSQTNGHSTEPATHNPTNGDVTDGAANQAGESQWDSQAEMSMSLSQEWVDVSVPRDPAETETGLSATPAAPKASQSWADESPENAPVPEVCRTRLYASSGRH